MNSKGYEFQYGEDKSTEADLHLNDLWMLYQYGILEALKVILSYLSFLQNLKSKSKSKQNRITLGMTRAKVGIKVFGSERLKNEYFN